MITVDKSLRFQQNLTDRRLSIITLDSPRVTLPHLVGMLAPLQAALGELIEGSFVTIRPVN